MKARAVIAAAMTALVAATAGAAAPAPPDADLLEFLGSLDTEEEEWRDYLAERPVAEDEKADKPPARPAKPVIAPRRAADRQQDEVKKP